MLNQRHAQRRIDWILDPEVADIDGTILPTREDFFEVWNNLEDKRKNVVAVLIESERYVDVYERISEVSLAQVINMLKKEADIARAVIIGRMLKLPSEVAQITYIENLVGTNRMRAMHRQDLINVIKTDREHLKELASQVNISGDGKRDLLKEIIAYGMQTKQVEDAVYDEPTGQVLRPAVYSLADPRMAFNAIQELNKMDHEYGVEDTATSSVESQAERIKRLQNKMPKKITQMLNSEAKKQAAKLNGTAKRVAQSQLRMERDERTE